MDERIARAVSRGHMVDITTTGRTSGLPRRFEVVFHAIDGRIFISGMPRLGSGPGSPTSSATRT